MSEEAAVLATETEQSTEIQKQPEGTEQKPAGTEGAKTEGEVEPGKEGSEHKEGGYQRVKRQREEAREEAKYWREQALKGASATKTESPAAQEPAEDPEPNPEDFTEEKGGMTAYLKAVRAYDRKQIVKEIESKQSQTEQARSAQTEAEKEAARFDESENAARTKFTDYDEASDAAIDAMKEHPTPAAKAVGKAIAAHEQGAELLYELGKNPAEVERLSKLSPTQAVMQLGVIAARIAGQEPATEKKEPPPQTRAPKPPSHVSKPSAAGKPFDPLDPSSYKDFAEYEKAMNARDLKAKG